MEALGTGVQIQQLGCLCVPITAPGGCQSWCPRFSRFETQVPPWALISPEIPRAPFDPFGNFGQPIAHLDHHSSYTPFQGGNTSSHCLTSGFFDGTSTLSNPSFSELTAPSAPSLNNNPLFPQDGDTINCLYEEPSSLGLDERGFNPSLLPPQATTNHIPSPLAPGPPPVYINNATTTSWLLPSGAHEATGTNPGPVTRSQTNPVPSSLKKKSCDHPKCTYEYLPNIQGLQHHRRHVLRNHRNHRPLICPKAGCEVTLTRADNFKSHWASRRSCKGYDASKLSTEALKREHKRYLRRFSRMTRESVNSSSESSSVGEDGGDADDEFLPFLVHRATV